MIFVSHLSALHNSRLVLPDWILSNTIKRFPILGESQYETLITGADSFTPDGRLIMNESAEVRSSPAFTRLPFDCTSNV